MGFFSNITRSFRKSKKLRGLQLKIAPPQQTAEDLVADFLEDLGSGDDPKDRALEEFFDLCESDDSVAMVMKKFNLDREELKKIYFELLAVGLGQWINGHYVALSTIAYYEPLHYLVESKRKGSSAIEIANDLLDYWSGSIRQGGLFKAAS